MNIVVNEEQKERWQEYADEEPRFDSVSDLVRTSVERHISTQNSGLGELNTEVLEDIAESLDSLESRVGSVDSELSMLRNENIKESLMSQIVKSEMSEVEDDLEKLEIVAKKILKEAKENPDLEEK
jgi:archaellum component FlaC